MSTRVFKLKELKSDVDTHLTEHDEGKVRDALMLTRKGFKYLNNCTITHHRMVDKIMDQIPTLTWQADPQSNLNHHVICRRAKLSPCIHRLLGLAVVQERSKMKKKITQFVKGTWECGWSGQSPICLFLIYVASRNDKQQQTNPPTQLLNYYRDSGNGKHSTTKPSSKNSQAS